MFELLSSILVLLLLAVLVAGVLLLGLAAAGVLAAGHLIEWIADLLIPGRKTGLGSTGIVEQSGVVVRPLAAESEGIPPEGTIQVAGELWTARCREGGALPQGSRVRVVGVDGMVAIVERAQGHGGASGP